MKIRIFDTYERMCQAAADLVAAQLLLKPDSHLGLTAGKTPVGMFAELIKLYQAGRVSFSNAWFYNLEEKMGVAPQDELSCHSYLHRHLLDHVDAKPERLRLPDGLSQDVEEECVRYEALLNSLPDGRLDMQILGIGSDAHIGMNRPAQALTSACHRVERPAFTYAAMGVRSILLAKRIVLMANGEDKAQAVADMCGGTISAEVPATLLQLHPEVTILLDRGAAAKIQA